MQLPCELQQKIVEFLTSLPEIVESRSLRAFINSSGLDSQLQKRIEFSGSVAQFFELLVPMLIDYGTLEDERNALEAVLETTKGYVGLDRQKYCDALIEELRAVRQEHQEREEKEKQVQKAETDFGELRKFFISYAHTDPDEETLANFLHSQFTQTGHEAFIDASMKAGMDWIQEITNRINWCEAFIVLLSEHSMQSEMVLEEVRIARRCQRESGLPKIIPIRLRDFGPLEYELEICLGHLQFVKWTGPQDSPLALAEIGRSLELKIAPGEQNRGEPADWINADQQLRPLSDLRRPQSAIDPRAAYIPGGTLRPDDPYYVTRPTDGLIHALADRHGETLIIKAPRQMGKSSLLLHYLAHGQQAGKQIALIDLSIFGHEDFATYPGFLTKIARLLVRSLRITLTQAPHIASQAEMTWFMEDQILSAIKAPLVIAFDETDRVLGRDYQADFFTMLRLWHNNRANITLPWDKVDIALVISTEPYLLIQETDRSPFNVSPPLELEPFTLAQCAELNGKYDQLLSEAEIEQLWELLQGHPYLTRLAYFRLCCRNKLDFTTLLQSAADDQGPFGDHLRALLAKLHRHPDLLQAMQAVIRKGAVPNDDLYYRLHGAGLVKRERGRTNPANLLYARYFKKAM